MNQQQAKAEVEKIAVQIEAIRVSDRSDEDKEALIMRLNNQIIDLNKQIEPPQVVTAKVKVTVPLPRIFFGE